MIKLQSNAVLAANLAFNLYKKQSIRKGTPFFTRHLKHSSFIILLGREVETSWGFVECSWFFALQSVISNNSRTWNIIPFEVPYDFWYKKWFLKSTQNKSAHYHHRNIPYFGVGGHFLSSLYRYAFIQYKLLMKRCQYTHDINNSFYISRKDSGLKFSPNNDKNQPSKQWVRKGSQFLLCWQKDRTSSSVTSWLHGISHSPPTVLQGRRQNPVTQKQNWNSQFRGLLTNNQIFYSLFYYCIVLFFYTQTIKTTKPDVPESWVSRLPHIQL